jgi:hypothetical protein
MNSEERPTVPHAVRAARARKLTLSQPWFRKWRTKINKIKFTITLISKQLRHYRRNTLPLKIFNENTA